MTNIHAEFMTGAEVQELALPILVSALQNSDSRVRRLRKRRTLMESRLQNDREGSGQSTRQNIDRHA